MIYFIYGNQIPMIRKRISKIVKEILGDEIDEMNSIKYDGTTDSMLDIISDCNILPLGCDHKVVVVENLTCLCDKTKKGSLSDEDKELFINYVNEPSEFADLIISLYDNPDKSKDIVKALIDHSKVLEMKEPTKEEWVNYVRVYMRNQLHVNIDEDAILELAKRTNNDSYSLINNGEKLALYSNTIRYEEVDMIVTKPLEQNVFQIFNYLMANKINDALIIYRNIISNDSSRIGEAVPILANEFRTLWKIRYLSKQGLSDAEIATKIATFDWKVRNYKKYNYVISDNKILEIIDTLFDLDLKIKNGSKKDFFDRSLLFELFLLNFNRTRLL